MFIVKNVNCKKTLKVFSEGKVKDRIEHLIAEYALKKQNTKSLCKTIYHPNFLFKQCFKEIFSISSSYGKFQKVGPPFDRGRGFSLDAHLIIYGALNCTTIQPS